MFRVKSWKDLRNTNWAAIFQCVASKKNKMILENLKTHQFDSLIQNVCVRQHNMALLRASLYSLPNYITALQLASHRPNHEILLETRISETVFVMTWMHTPVSGPNPYMTYVIYVCIYIYIIISPNRRKSESLLIWWFTFLVVGFNHLEKNEIVNGFRMTSHIWNGK